VFSINPHQTFIKIDQNNLVVPVPAAIDASIAAATRMAGVGTSAIVMAEVGLCPWVVVFGLGMVGNLAAQGFGILGAKVIGVDPVASRRKLAERCGVRWTVGGTPEEAHKAIAEITGGAMADISVEATGFTPVVLQAIRATANVGQVVLLGSPRAAMAGDLTPAFRDIHIRYLTVRGALEWCPPAYTPMASGGGRSWAIPSLYSKQMMIFDWVQSGRMKIEPLITHRLAPGKIKEAYEGLLRQSETYIGVALDWRKAEDRTG
jgi:threonine dehydrogenase-like Zn-dependent dehydrogenase